MTKTEWYSALAGAGYIANDSIIYTLMNAMLLKVPILVEGAPGVGKTELAKAVSKALDLPLLRVQFYEGIQNRDIMYEYDYARQMLTTLALQSNIEKGTDGLSIKDALDAIKDQVDIYDESFLIQRPLLAAINGNGRKVLLLDEIDKTSEETEFALLELLSDFSMSIPELGKTVVCPEDQIPIVFLTSNNARELSDALRRRCLYLYMPDKTTAELADIIRSKAEVSEKFSHSVAEQLQEIRELDLKQKPSVAEGITWAKILKDNFGGREDVSGADYSPYAGALAKNKGDLEVVTRFLSGQEE